MAYTRVNWEDLPSTNTPRNATNLNKMDAGIKDNDDRIKENEDKLLGTKPMGSIVVDDIKCKNLFGVNSMAIRSGVTSIYNGSTLTLNGTSTGENFNEDYTLKMVRLPAGTYTFTIKAISGTKTGSQSLVIRNIDNNSSILDTNFTGNYTYTFTLNQDTNINVLIYYLASGNVFTNYVMNIQIEQGSEATPYTPYKKIIKEENGYVKESTTFYANDFKCKNMFDKSNVVAGYLSNAGNVVSNTQYSTSDYINVKGIGNITISGSSGNSENICFYDSSQAFISFISTGANATLTTSVPSNAYYCRITVKNTNLDLVQLEVGSEATPYTPFVEVATSVETIDISSYATTSVSSVSRAYIQRVGHIYRFNIVCNVGSASSTAVILFNNLPFTPAFITELNSVNGNNVTVRCFYDNGQIKISSSQATTYFINGTMII